MAQLKLDIVVDDKGTATIKGFGEAIKGVGGDTAGLDKQTMSLGSSLLKLGAAVGGVYVVQKAFREAAAAISDWVAAAKESEKADTNLASVIKSTGMAAGYTMMLPDNDLQHVFKSKLKAELSVFLAGRAAADGWIRKPFGAFALRRLVERLATQRAGKASTA